MAATTRFDSFKMWALKWLPVITSYSIHYTKLYDIVSKYRKIHLPGHAEHEPWRAFQHLVV